MEASIKIIRSDDAKDALVGYGSARPFEQNAVPLSSNESVATVAIEDRRDPEQ